MADTVIGKGGYGTVSIMKIGGETLAVKTYDGFPDLNEVDCLATFDHPNVMSSKGLAFNDGNFFVFMPLGVPITKSKNKTKTVFDLMNGLAYIHRSGVLHLDIKAQNSLYMEAEDKSVIIDFGSCVAGSDKDLEEGMISIKERITYLNRDPELSYMEMTSQERIVSKATDVFSLGWTFVCMFDSSKSVPTNKEMVEMYTDYKKYGDGKLDIIKFRESHTLCSYYYHKLYTRNGNVRMKMLNKIVPDDLEQRDYIIDLIFNMLEPISSRLKLDQVIKVTEEGSINSIFTDTFGTVDRKLLLRVKEIIPNEDVVYLFMICEFVYRTRIIPEYAIAYVLKYLIPNFSLYRSDPSKHFLRLFNDIFDWKPIIELTKGIFTVSNSIYKRAASRDELIDAMDAMMLKTPYGDIYWMLGSKFGDKNITIDEFVDQLF